MDERMLATSSFLDDVAERVLDSRASEQPAWTTPLPLTPLVEAEPYPLDALPPLVRAAVEEVAGFVKAPVPLVASSALGAVSLAAQAHADVMRMSRLQGPVGLFLLVIADSGERKSTCDGFFTQAFKDYEASQAASAKPLELDYRAAFDAWDAKRSGVKEALRQSAKAGKPTADLETALRELEHARPDAPRVPRLLYADATPEALAYELASRWPSGGVMSAEAGVVFGSHGMGKDSAMRNLALLNQLWDGKSLQFDRRTTESFAVHSARLTVTLQVQEATLREFMTRTGGLARGTGFLARFLVAWPESTQGQRFIDPTAPDGPAGWPRLKAFHERIAEILNQPAAINGDGSVTPQVLSLAQAAQSQWIEFHNAIEAKLSRGGTLHDVRDVASKSADNAARLAALFHLFQGADGPVSEAAMVGASRVAAWHLNEARRFFGVIGQAAGSADAARLDRWLIEHCLDRSELSVAKNHVRQHGPLRDGARLDAAISELEDLERLRLDKHGKRFIIRVNPSLLEGAQ